MLGEGQSRLTEAVVALAQRCLPVPVTELGLLRGSRGQLKQALGVVFYV
jgi:hypothetical protein